LEGRKNSGSLFLVEDKHFYKRLIHSVIEGASQSIKHERQKTAVLSWEWSAW